ncbi:hypothetical protein GY45DRAFT_941654 [Cubamyces sp. BRFM 1775]|nr:hypothetical protein GY45DRAFT_941654 [Cubamyces sp. BRFM 1775]
MARSQLRGTEERWTQDEPPEGSNVPAPRPGVEVDGVIRPIGMHPASPAPAVKPPMLSCSSPSDPRECCWLTAAGHCTATHTVLTTENKVTRSCVNNHCNDSVEPFAALFWLHVRRPLDLASLPSSSAKPHSATTAVNTAVAALLRDAYIKRHLPPPPQSHHAP